MYVSTDANGGRDDDDDDEEEDAMPQISLKVLFSLVQQFKSDVEKRNGMNPVYVCVLCMRMRLSLRETSAHCAS